MHNECGSFLKKASETAFETASKVDNWIPKDKHLLGSTAKRSAKFVTNDFGDVRAVVAEALRSPNAMFLPNNVEGSFQVVTDLGRIIGTKGQTKVRVIVGKEGQVWNAFPVHVR